MGEERVGHESDQASQSPPTVGISLSGGGHRAALFGLGALLAVVDSGLNASTCWIASVSGGSMANALALSNGDFSQATPEKFEKICLNAIERLSRGGAFTSMRLGHLRFTLYLMALVGLPVAIYSTGMYLTHSWLASVTASVIVISVIWRARGLLVERGIGNLWCAGAATLLRRDDIPVEHLFVASDIRRGQPVFLGNSYIGTAGVVFKTGRLLLARAVRASAAFPLFLPPVWLLRERHVRPILPPTEQHKRSRTWLLLADGGIYNNLGTDWPDRAGRMSHTTDHLIIKAIHRDPVDLHLVVDSGLSTATSRTILHRVPVLGPFYTLARIYKTTYTSVIDRAGDGSRNQILISHTVRPGLGLTFPNFLKMPKDDWRACAWTTRGEGTHLWHVEQKRALRIVAHGYALTMDRLTRRYSIKNPPLDTVWEGNFGRAVKATLPVPKNELRRLNRRLPGIEW